jgi:hypothetical protein
VPYSIVKLLAIKLVMLTPEKLGWLMSVRTLCIELSHTWHSWAFVAEVPEPDGTDNWVLWEKFCPGYGVLLLYVAVFCVNAKALSLTG